MDAIQARLRAQEEENRRLAAERKRKLEELQQKVRAHMSVYVRVFVCVCVYAALHAELCAVGI